MSTTIVRRPCIACGKWKDAQMMFDVPKPKDFAYATAYMCSECIASCPLCSTRCAYTYVLEHNRCEACVASKKKEPKPDTKEYNSMLEIRACNAINAQRKGYVCTSEVKQFVLTRCPDVHVESLSSSSSDDFEPDD